VLAFGFEEPAPAEVKPATFSQGTPKSTGLEEVSLKPNTVAA
jgi:hypothetical protein